MTASPGDDDDTLAPFVQAIRQLGDKFEQATELLKVHRARWAALRAGQPKPVVPPEDRKPGDTWRVRVGAQIFDSIVDPRGTPRFRENRVIRDLYDAASKGHRLDANEIIARFQMGRYRIEDIREFDALIGYSHCGFLELSYNSYPEENYPGVEPVDIEEI